jgi:tripartite-type tricarboxylate transporter receptor subunit TctC
MDRRRPESEVQPDLRQPAAAAPSLLKSRQGRLVALGVSGSKRSPQAANVPTIAEEIAPGFDATFHESLQMPKATPRAVVDKIQADVAKALAVPDLRARLADLDLEPMG